MMPRSASVDEPGVLSRGASRDGVHSEESSMQRGVSPLLGTPVHRSLSSEVKEACSTGATASQPMAPRRSTKESTRLASLDIVRGITVAVMIFVDDIGSAYPVLTHAPWNGLHFADFVMPWFLFIVGTSLAISTRRARQSRAMRRQVTRSACWRTLKLFVLGVLLQGRGWPQVPSVDSGYSFGYNLHTMRFCGILQRIAFAFLVTCLIDIWVPEVSFPGTSNWSVHALVFSSQVYKWCIALFTIVVHASLTFGVWVPSWTSTWGWVGDAETGDVGLLPEPFEVKCNVRGAIATPECSVAGFIDRTLFGQNRLGVWESERLPQCSSCAPGAPDDRYRPDCRYLVKPDNGASVPWCFAHIYDPEGALASIPTVMTVWLGVHFGRVVLAAREQGGLGGTQSTSTSRRPWKVPLHWAILSSALMLLGLVIHFAGWPMNKQLWSASYNFFTAGSCGLALALVYVLVDIQWRQPDQDRQERPEVGPAVAAGAAPATASKPHIARTLLAPFEMMGMNAIFVFFWYFTAEVFLTAFYVAPVGGHDTLKDRAKGTLFGEYGWIHETALAVVFKDAAVRQLVYVLLKVSAFLVATWWCYRQKYFWKL